MEKKSLRHKTKRDESLDKLRGFAVLAMVVFHLFYDLNAFRFVQLNFSTGFWFWFPRLIAFLFLFCVGASLQKAYAQKIKWKKFGIRFFKIAGGAIVISLTTYILFPKTWIFFGTLHCIALSSLLGLVFLNRPYTSLITSVLILVSFKFLNFNIQKMGRQSMDFIPLYPWFFAVLWGIFYEIKNGQKLILPLTQKAPNFLILLGKKALPIYLLHQPLLFGSCFLFHTLFKSMTN